ncbi:MAG: hypothetical protein Aureis2KO_12650 [Aureisphaera sp.]
MMKTLLFACLSLVTTLCFSQIERLSSYFDDETLDEWTNIDTSETLLSVGIEAPGYLHKECDGTETPVGEMTVINTSEDWTGNHWYVAGGDVTTLAAITELSMRNPNDFDLHIRFGFTGANGFQAVTHDPIIVPALSDWDTYEPYYDMSFPSFINIEIITDTSGMPFLEVWDNMVDMFGAVTEFRIFHNEEISYDGELVNGVLDIDFLNPVFLLSSNDLEKQYFTIFPNPSNHMVYVSSGTEEVQSVSVYSMTGAKMMQTSHVDSGMDLSSLASGIYFIEITSTKGRETHRVVKE